MQIICFGDSNTYGYDPRSYFGDRYEAENRWVDLLAKQTGKVCVNAGMNGREIPRFSFPPQLKQYSPADTILIMLGTNDLLQGASARDAAMRMEAFLAQLLTGHPNVILVAPPPMRRGTWVLSEHLITQSVNLAEHYRTVAEKLRVPFVDTGDWNIELAFDGIHFTEAGHRAFAAGLAEYIR